MTELVFLTGLVTTAGGGALAVLYARLREPRESQIAAARKIAAIDSGRRCRLVCSVRATHSGLPGRFAGYIAELAPGGIVLRPGLLLRFRYRTMTITEPMLSARQRQFADHAEQRHFGATGLYAAGAPLEMSGRVIITCQTPGGTLEFGVTRRNVPVLLHYLGRRQS